MEGALLHNNAGPIIIGDGAGKESIIPLDNKIAGYTDDKVTEKKVFDIDDVEIFRVGTWNGDKYSQKDLEDIVKSFEEIGGVLKPFVKLGHNGKQGLLKSDGMPAAGWITSLKMKGDTLLAKFSSVPEKIYELIKNKAYGRISAEIYWNIKNAGKTHRRALKAVALLGADTPAVGTLDDFINLYTEEYEYDKLELCNKMEETNMDEKFYTDKISTLETEIKDYKENEEKIKSEEKIKLETQVKEFSAKEKTYADQIADLTSKNVNLEKEVKEKAYEAKEAEVDSYLDKQNITPVQIVDYKSIAMGEMTYTKDGQEVTGFDMVKSILDNATGEINLGDTSQKSNTSDKAYSKADETDNDKLHTEVKSYMKENKCSYAEAYEAIADEQKFDGGE